ncbi:motile sperm domain-containing protein 1-like [Anarhichas minor]|uniref:motile sperm domain-containing protein 1-like n=1 Tax=Anarhichas minor TaxID=65739 RepID=UPI003F73F114
MRREDSRDVRGRGGDRGQAVVVRQEGETGGVSPLRVFLFPSELLFYCEQRSSHRRVLTLYNPSSLSFRILCKAPCLYRVVESEGSVRPRSCVDLVVHHLDVSPRHRGRRDRFRLEVRGGGGGWEIWAELRGGEDGVGREEEGEEEEETKRRGQGAVSSAGAHTHTHLQLPTCTGETPETQCTLGNVVSLVVLNETLKLCVSLVCVCVLLFLLCVTVLMLPLHTDGSSVVPLCLHISTNQKLVCAYTLGNTHTPVTLSVCHEDSPVCLRSSHHGVSTVTSL